MSALTHDVTETPSAPQVRFGSFLLDFGAEQLLRDGVSVALAPQPFRLLRYLVNNPGRLVTREEIQTELWGADTFVDFERGLNFCILQLRTALGDDARRPIYIETVPRRGYRFIAPVSSPEVRPVPAAAPVRSRRRSWIAVAIAIGAGALVTWALSQDHANPQTRVMLAVLPLEDLNGTTRPYFADGLTEEVITELGQLDPQHVGVIARTSVMQFRGTKKDIRAIAKQLNVDYVLEGSVRYEANRIRATFQLIRGDDGTHVWAESYDHPSTDVLSLQSQLAARVGSALRLRLAPAQTPRAHNAGALDAYLRGRALWSGRSTAEVEASVTHFDRAIALDPGFASAHVALAESWHMLAIRGRVTPMTARARIGTHVDRALRIDPGLASAHAARGTLLLWYDWKFDEAERAFRHALELNASSAAARHDYAWLLIARGRSAEGIREMRFAQELDPLSPRSNIDVAWAYIYTGRYADAIAEARRTLGMDPEFEEAHRCLQHAHELSGDLASAVAEAKLRAIALDRGEALSGLESLPPSEALRRIHELRLQQLLIMREERYVDPYRLAAEAAWLGRTEDALRWLEEARETRSLSLPLAGVDPMLRSLHSDLRFKALLQILN
jgi:TolB-like protein/DNA-binding winged helix-turn-helix (wHTH) protein/tetratricopeptide (TPR) repeat protein